ncbi:hypothetical protein AB1Y20_001550 [Prymnesium parvum]|uniref:Uncharacterized protein n=1 Tax=Prymnesium parvum TaxID=97485 RepID=A0AB34KE02_PRYPA
MPNLALSLPLSLCEVTSSHADPDQFSDFDAYLSARRATYTTDAQDKPDIQAAISQAAQRISRRRAQQREEELQKIREAHRRLSSARPQGAASSHSPAAGASSTTPSLPTPAPRDRPPPLTPGESSGSDYATPQSTLCISAVRTSTRTHTPGSVEGTSSGALPSRDSSLPRESAPSSTVPCPSYNPTAIASVEALSSIHACSSADAPSLDAPFSRDAHSSADPSCSIDPPPTIARAALRAAEMEETAACVPLLSVARLNAHKAGWRARRAMESARGLLLREQLAEVHRVRSELSLELRAAGGEAASFERKLLSQLEAQVPRQVEQLLELCRQPLPAPAKAGAAVTSGRAKPHARDASSLAAVVRKKEASRVVVPPRAARQMRAEDTASIEEEPSCNARAQVTAPPSSHPKASIRIAQAKGDEAPANHPPQPPPPPPPPAADGARGATRAYLKRRTFTLKPQRLDWSGVASRVGAPPALRAASHTASLSGGSASLDERHSTCFASFKEGDASDRSGACLGACNASLGRSNAPLQGGKASLRRGSASVGRREGPHGNSYASHVGRYASHTRGDTSLRDGHPGLRGATPSLRGSTHTVQQPPRGGKVHAPRARKLSMERSTVPARYARTPFVIPEQGSEWEARWEGASRQDRLAMLAEMAYPSCAPPRTECSDTAGNFGGWGVENEGAVVRRTAGDRGAHSTESVLRTLLAPNIRPSLERHAAALKEI